MSGFLFSLFLISLHTIGVAELHVPFDQLEITCLFLFLALSCLLFSLLNPKRSEKKTQPDNVGSIWLGLLFVWGVIGFFYSVRPDMSFQLVAEYITGIALLLFLNQTLRTLEQVRRLFWLLAGIAGFQGVLSWALQFYFPTVDTTINFVFLNSNFRADYLLFPLAMSATLFLTESEKTRKTIAWFLFVLIWAQLGFTNSRGAHISAGVMMFLLILALLRNRDKKNTGILLLGFGMGRLLFHLLFMNFGGGQEGSVMMELSPTTPSYSYRKVFWESALQIFAHYPLIGSGPWTFSLLFPYHFPFIGIEVPPTILPVPHAHSLYLQILSDMGLIGLFLLLAAFLFFFKGLFPIYWKNRGPDSLFALGLMIGTAGYLTHSLVDTMWPSPYFLFTVVIIFGSAQTLTTTSSPPEKTAKSRKVWTTLVIGVLFIGTGVLWTTFSYSQKLIAFQSDKTSIEDKIILTGEASALCPLCIFPSLYHIYVLSNQYEKTHDPVFRIKAEQILEKIQRKTSPFPEAHGIRGTLSEIKGDYVQAMKHYLLYYKVSTHPFRPEELFERIRMKKQLEASSQQ